MREKQLLRCDLSRFSRSVSGWVRVDHLTFYGRGGRLLKRNILQAYLHETIKIVHMTTAENQKISRTFSERMQACYTKKTSCIYTSRGKKIAGG